MAVKTSPDTNAGQQHDPNDPSQRQQPPGDNSSTSRTGVGGGGSASGTGLSGQRSNGARVDSPSQLQRGESFAGNRGRSGPGTSQTDGESRFNPDGDKERRFSGVRSKILNAKGRLSKKKWLVGAGIVGGGGFMVTLILLFLFISALKIPDFAQHITEYQFARVTREYSKSVERVTAEDIAQESASNKLWSQAKATYGTLRDNTWGKLDSYRPGIIIKNLGIDNGLTFNYQPSGLLGRQQLVGITLDNQTYLVKNVNGVLNYIPGVKQGLNLKNQAEFWQTFSPALDEALQDNNVGLIIRGLVANNLRKQAGISLVAWAASKFGGDTDAQAALEQAREAYKAIDEPTPEAAVTSPEEDAIQKAAQQETADVNNPSTLQKILNNGGVDPAVSNILQSAFSSSTLTTALNATNPVYGVAMPMCIIYDGSLDKAQGSIDANTTEEERSYYYVESAADQQKYGDTDGEAVGAMVGKLGDITQSNTEIRADGGIVNTSATFPAEASPDGQYSLLNVLFSKSVASALNIFANTACPVITNTFVGIGIGAANIVAALASGGGNIGAEQAASSGAESLLGSIADNFLSRFVGDKTGTIAGKAGDIITDTVKTGGMIGGATMAAKLIVMADANSLHNGLEQNLDFDNETDAGGNFTANQIDQNMNYGGALSYDEINQSNQATHAELVDETAKESVYDRYASLGNADSLLSKTAILASGDLKLSTVASFLNLGSKLLNPLKNLASLFTAVDNPAFAAGNSDTSDYGNVQFGWSQAEENLIDSDSSYDVLANTAIVDQNPQQEADIASTYGPCFTDSIGTLEQNGDIIRDANGNVTGGICSDQYLSYNSADTTLGADPSSPNHPNDMIFRWRLMNRYDNTLDQLIDEQTATTTDSSTSVPTSVSTSGYLNPFRDVKNLGTSRVDEGTDFTGSGPVYAVGDGTVLGTTNSGWPGGTFIAYQLTGNGAAKGDYVYMAENCNNIQVHVGETVHSTTVLCTMVDSSPYIETGWADGTAIGAAAAKSVYDELPSGASYATAYGQNFTEFLDSLGVTTKSCYDFPGAPLSGSLPANWPVWTSNPATKSGSLSCN
jgi:hypothetical protein